MATLTSLAEELLAKAKEIDAYAASKGLPLTSHIPKSELPEHLQHARDTIINNSELLKRLANNPDVTVMDIATNFADATSLRMIYRYNLAALVPVNGSTSYDDLASQSSLPKPLVFRFIRYAIANGIFDETPDGHVCHSPASLQLATNPSLGSAVGFFVEELAAAAFSYPEAVDKYGASQEQSETPFALHNGGREPLFQLLKKHPERLKRFGGCMQFLSSTPASDVRHIQDGFDWKSVDVPGTVMVDVGGGHGQACHFLSTVTANIKFIVQDLPHVTEQGRAASPAHCAGRVEYAAHDFLTPQVGPPVDLVFIRWTLHNWSDKYVVTILKNLVPVMKNGSRVLIMDYVLDEAPARVLTKKPALNMDMAMGVLLNSRERTARQFQELFGAADERFVFNAVVSPSASNLSVVEFAWEST